MFAFSPYQGGRMGSWPVSCKLKPKAEQCHSNDGESMPFTFSMQKILDYREQQEEEAKTKFAQAQNLVLHEEERLEQLRILLVEKETELNRNIEMDANSRWLFDTFIKGLRSDIDISLTRLRQFKEIREQCRQILLERAKKRKIMDKLKEKQRERYYAEEKEQERKTNDETATLRYGTSPF